VLIIPPLVPCILYQSAEKGVGEIAINVHTYKAVVRGAYHKMLLPFYCCMISTGGSNGTEIYLNDFAVFI
jgi:hypothetical protein